MTMTRTDRYFICTAGGTLHWVARIDRGRIDVRAADGRLVESGGATAGRIAELDRQGVRAGSIDAWSVDAARTWWGSHDAPA